MDSDTELRWVNMISAQFRFQKVMTKDMILWGLRGKRWFCTVQTASTLTQHTHLLSNNMSQTVVQLYYVGITIQTQRMLTVQMPMDATFDQSHHHPLPLKHS